MDTWRTTGQWWVRFFCEFTAQERMTTLNHGKYWLHFPTERKYADIGDVSIHMSPLLSFNPNRTIVLQQDKASYIIVSAKREEEVQSREFLCWSGVVAAAAPRAWCLKRGRFAGLCLKSSSCTVMSKWLKGSACMKALWTCAHLRSILCDFPLPLLTNSPESMRAEMFKAACLQQTATIE